MSAMMPPLSKPELQDESPRRRLYVHLWHIALAALTVCATTWCYQIHIGLGLAATFLAKHILVAILAAGMRLPIEKRSEPEA